MVPLKNNQSNCKTEQHINHQTVIDYPYLLHKEQDYYIVHAAMMIILLLLKNITIGEKLRTQKTIGKNKHRQQYLGQYN